MKIIQLREVLQQIENGEPFSITIIKADRQRQTGGEIITYENCRLYKKHSEKKQKSKISSRRGNAIPDGSPRDSRNPNHYLHQTRNVQLQNGEIRKIHIRLIVKFNGVQVIY